MRKLADSAKYVIADKYGNIESFPKDLKWIKKICENLYRDSAYQILKIPLGEICTNKCYLTKYEVVYESPSFLMVDLTNPIIHSEDDFRLHQLNNLEKDAKYWKTISHPDDYQALLENISTMKRYLDDIENSTKKILEAQ